MTWWIRFCLGLPARPEDIEEIRNSVPELLSPDLKLAANVVIPFWPHLILNELALEELQRWVARSEEFKGRRPFSAEDCPADDCPLRSGLFSTDKRPDVVFEIARLIVGGTHKPPKDEFLDLVRRVHKNQNAREVILTDPYIYVDVGESQIRGGYSNLVDYLHALGLKEDSKFKLKLNPSPKKNTKKPAQELLRRVVTKAFPHARFGTLRSGYHFHDRFYLVRDDSGGLSGVFGPSLNGLGSREVVLMGELERTKTLDRLQRLV